MRETKLYTLFVASPSDVLERRLVPELVNNWNSENYSQYDVVFTTSMWEVNLSTEFNATAQDLINKKLLYQSDLAMVLFWNRFGAPTGSSVSGTYEELTKAIEKNIRTGLFFCQKAIRPNEIDIEGQKEIQDLRNKIHSQEFVSNGVYHDYSNEYDFKEKVYRFLTSFAESETATIDSDDEAISIKSDPDGLEKYFKEIREELEKKLNLKLQTEETGDPSKVELSSPKSKPQTKKTASDIKKLELILKDFYPGSVEFQNLERINFEEPFNINVFDSLRELTDTSVRFSSFDLEKYRRRLISNANRLIKTVYNETLEVDEVSRVVPKNWIETRSDQHFNILRALVVNRNIVISTIKRLYNELESRKK